MDHVKVVGLLKTANPKGDKLIGSFTVAGGWNATDADLDHLREIANVAFSRTGWDRLQFWELTERCVEILEKQKSKPKEKAKAKAKAK